METHPSRGRAIAGAATKPAKESDPQTRWVCLIYLSLTGERPTILQRGKISPRLLTKPTFPPNRSSSSWRRSDTMGKSHPLLIGERMRSASSALLIVLSTTSLHLFDEELSPPGEM